MTERIRKLRKFFIEDRAHFALRQEAKDPYRYAARYAAEGLDDLARSVRRLSDGLAEEKPHVFPDEKIALIRTVRTVPEIHTKEETAALRKKHYFHEQGKVCNVSPDYTMLLARGFDAVREEIGGYAASFRENGEEEKARYEEALLAMLDTVSGFAQRYREEALRAGNAVVAESFSQIPSKPPRTFLEALQFLRLIHYTLWMCWHYHNTFGRFDQYMEPYFRADLEKGILTEEGALELIEEFFLSLNRDSDMYPGMQQGDNGQSLVLGGITKDGTDGFGLLSELCLKASLELKTADPKINVRVNKNTPVEEYIRCTELTKAGLGFPQYSNDDVVIPGLLSWGYRPEDAREYAVAACWEFIIPGYGMDIPNVDSLSFPACVLNAVQRIGEADTFEDLMEMVHGEIDREAARLRGRVHDLYLEPAPFLSLMMHGTKEAARDCSEGLRYNNFGFHGSGLSTAVDSLAAVRAYVYEDGSLTKERLLSCLENDFAGEGALLHRLRYEAPKMGNNDDRTDALATRLLDWFADSMEGYANERGGIFRAGTGSAMYYIWQSREMGATPDGRRKGEAFAANYSPSLFVKLDGPVSIIQSFAKPHLSRVANGGPLTIELSDSMFRNKESVEKTARFVKTFLDLGGHQMQINAVNYERMKDAKEHPENHRNLIVRVWGWSGYFVELDECYQDHIMKRMELTVD